MKTEVKTVEPETPSEVQVSRKKQRLNVNNSVVTEIIQKGRVEYAPARGALILSACSFVLLWACFTPVEFGPLAWVALVPFLQLVRIPQKTKWMYCSVYATGFLYTLATLQWMRLGHIYMYPAWLALSVYWAFYFPVFLGVSRVAHHKLKVPFVLAVPVAWVGLEYFRAYMMTGFSWYYLGHSQYLFGNIIQISDLVGAYGVSFLVAMLNASLAILVGTKIWDKFNLVTKSGESQIKPISSRQKWTAVLAGLFLFSAAFGYGYARRSQAEFKAGPRVALIQGNYPPEVKHSPDPAKAREMFNMHYRMTGKAVKYQPDLIVWPESMYQNWLFQSAPGLTDDQLQKSAPNVPLQYWKESNVPELLTDLSRQAGAGMFMGLIRVFADGESSQKYNSVAFVDPKKGLQGAYDKMHRVIFGEYIPLRETFPWLKKLTPYAGNFGIDAGDEAAIFDYKGWNFSPIICFEDTVPHLVRNVVKAGLKSDQKIDCLVNATNDGWFRGSSELNQHMITSMFRCVECRTPMVRAVNTGISTIIDGNGMIVEPVAFVDMDEKGRKTMRDPKTGKFHKELNAVLVGDVPLDNRESFYVKTGDWFAASCSFGTISFLIFGIFPFGFVRKKKS